MLAYDIDVATGRALVLGNASLGIKILLARSGIHMG